MIKKAAIMFGLRGGGAVAVFFVNIVMARLVSPSEYGAYAFIASMVSLLSVFVCLGCDTFLKRESASLDKKKWRTSLFPLLRDCAKLQLLLLPVGIALVTAAVAQSEIPIQLTLIAMASIWLLATVQSKNISSLLIGTSKPIVDTAITQLGRPLVAILLLVILTIYVEAENNSIGIAELIASQTIAMISMVLVAAAVFKFSFSRTPQDKTLRIGSTNASKDKPNTVTPLRLAKLCVPFALLSSITIVERNADTIMLTLLDSLDSTAMYYASTRISATFLMALFVLNAIATPTIVKSYRSGNIKLLENTAQLIAKYSSALTLALFVVVLLFGKNILLLFGEPYVNGYVALVILSAGNLLRNLFGPVLLVASMTGQEKIATKISVMSLILNIILNFLLIPFMGVAGAALATALTRVGRVVTLASMIKRNVGINTAIYTRKLKQ